MTTFYARELLGTIETANSGLDLIRSIYAIVYHNNDDEQKVLLGSLAKGTRILRQVHMSLCKSIGVPGGLEYEDAKVETLPDNLKVVLETMDLVQASIFAAAKNPFLHDMRKMRQEAAMEQIYSAVLLLEGLIEVIERPRR